MYNMERTRDVWDWSASVEKSSHFSIDSSIL